MGFMGLTIRVPPAGGAGGGCGGRASRCHARSRACAARCCGGRGAAHLVLEQLLVGLGAIPHLRWFSLRVSRLFALGWLAGRSPSRTTVRSKHASACKCFATVKPQRRGPGQAPVKPAVKRGQTSGQTRGRAHRKVPLVAVAPGQQLQLLLLRLEPHVIGPLPQVPRERLLRARQVEARLRGRGGWGQKDS